MEASHRGNISINILKVRDLPHSPKPKILKLQPNLGIPLMKACDKCSVWVKQKFGEILKRTSILHQNITSVHRLKKAN